MALKIMQASVSSVENDLSLLSDVCDKQVLHLSRVLSTIESKYRRLTCDLSRKEDDTAHANDRLVKTEQAVQQLKSEFEQLREVELLRRHEVGRLEALLEAERLQASLAQHRLQGQLAEEQARADRFRALREDALAQREDAMSELASAYADMEAMQATLADSAVYVRYLRRKVLELEVENSRHAARSMLSEQSQQQATGCTAGAFSLSSIKTAICQAVDEAFACCEDERKKRLKQLQLRWHPDKNPVLTEVATEVTKLIHEAVSAAEARAGRS